MQPPFAARRDEPVGRQHLQNVIPARALAARGQTLGPEAVEPQVAPQNPRQPTRAKLARAAKPHLIEAQPDDVVALSGFAPIFRIKRERARLLRVFVEDFDRPAPGFRLRGVDLAEVKDVTLGDAAIAEPSVLDDASIEMRLPILPPLGLAQKHNARIVPRCAESGNPMRV